MPRPTIQVAGIGNAIVDVLSRAEDSFLQDRALDKGTMRLIDEREAAMLYAAMGQATEMSGGSGANTVSGLASFGTRCAFIGRVRNDQLGDVFAHDIRALGVRYETQAAVTGPATARCLVLITPDGERTMSTFLGASAELDASDVPENIIGEAAITYLEGYLWDPAPAKEAFLKAAGIAHASGRKVALTLSDPFCVERHREEFRNLVEREVDILFANEAEIKSLYEVPNFDAALQAVRRDGLLAVLTRGPAGCVIVQGGETHVVEAQKVDTVVDTTGAGDLFAAGFLFGLCEQKPLARCGQLGALAAAEIISHVGARPEADLAALAATAGL